MIYFIVKSNQPCAKYCKCFTVTDLKAVQCEYMIYNFGVSSLWFAHFFYCWNIWILLFCRHDSHPKTFLNFGLNIDKLNIPANWEKCTIEIVLILTFMVYVQNAIATTLISELLSYYTPSINPYPLSRKLVDWRGFGGTEVMNTTDNRSLFY